MTYYMLPPHLACTLETSQFLGDHHPSRTDRGSDMGAISERISHVETAQLAAVHIAAHATPRPHHRLVSQGPTLVVVNMISSNAS